LWENCIGEKHCGPGKNEEHEWEIKGVSKDKIKAEYNLKSAEQENEQSEKEN